MDKFVLEDMIRTMSATERDIAEATASIVLECVKTAGGISVMPNPNLPTNGMLLMVHPKVYDRLRQLTKAEGE